MLLKLIVLALAGVAVLCGCAAVAFCLMINTGLEPDFIAKVRAELEKD